MSEIKDKIFTTEESLNALGEVYTKGVNARKQIKRRNEMNINELSKILENHKLWLEDPRKGERANLECANLGDADLSNANLRRADLSNANLRRADLSNANLRRADLSNANLRRANLRRADLSDAILRRADLSDAYLRDAN